MAAQLASRIQSVALLILLLVTGVWPLHAQSLADVAKKEEDRRKTLPAPAKVYTNKDLKAPPAGSEPRPAAPGKPADDPAKTPEKSAKDAKDPNDTKDAEPAKDQAYWAGRLKALRDKLERDQTFAEAVQTRLNSLATDIVNRDDPAQRGVLERDRQKSLATLNSLKQDVQNDKKAIADFEEEARRAGVPPGWLR